MCAAPAASSLHREMRWPSLLTRGPMNKTLLKGLALLEALSGHGGKPVPIPVLAKQLGLTKSNAHRTLQTLAHAGYATLDEASGSYRSTFKLFELGARQMAQINVRQFASRQMRVLAD